MPITENPRPPKRLCRSIRCGISRMQGGHQLAQKSIRTILPRKACRLTGAPFKSGRTNCGAIAPGISLPGAASAASPDRANAMTAAARRMSGRTAGGIAFVDPVGAEILVDVQGLHVGEAHRHKLLIGRRHIGAFPPRA